jgi:hypothetical protein
MLSINWISNMLAHSKTYQEVYWFDDILRCIDDRMILW